MLQAELYRVRKAFEKAEPLYLNAINILEEAFGSEDIRCVLIISFVMVKSSNFITLHASQFDI